MTTSKTDPRRARGQAGEDLAAAYLEAHDYQIIARNWRPGDGAGASLRGEVDIIAWLDQTLCFIEVKARTGTSHGAPQEAVGPSKQRQLSRLANAYISIHNLPDVPCRFDVVEVWLSGAEPRLELRANAFDYRGPQHEGRIF